MCRNTSNQMVQRKALNAVQLRCKRDESTGQVAVLFWECWAWEDWAFLAWAGVGGEKDLGMRWSLWWSSLTSDLWTFQIHRGGGEGVSVARRVFSLETTWRKSEGHLNIHGLWPAALYSPRTRSGASPRISPLLPVRGEGLWGISGPTLPHSDLFTNWTKETEVFWR